MDAITAAEGHQICLIAGSKEAMTTPYKWAGNTLGENGGADCAGFVWAAYQGAKYEYRKVGADPDTFGDSLSEGKSNAGLFIEVTDMSKLQEGDIGIYQGHMVMYAGKENGIEMVYSTHGDQLHEGRTPDKKPLSDWNNWVGHKVKKWYRYNKSKDPTSGSEKKI